MRHLLFILFSMFTHDSFVIHISFVFVSTCLIFLAPPSVFIVRWKPLVWIRFITNWTNGGQSLLSLGVSLGFWLDVRPFFCPIELACLMLTSFPHFSNALPPVSPFGIRVFFASLPPPPFRLSSTHAPSSEQKLMSSCYRLQFLPYNSHFLFAVFTFWFDTLGSFKPCVHWD